MSNYKAIATSSYVCEHRQILKDFAVWKRMNDEEKDFYRPCYKCGPYKAYSTNTVTNICPCDTCGYRKTEVQVDNRTKTLRLKYS